MSRFSARLMIRNESVLPPYPLHIIISKKRKIVATCDDDVAYNATYQREPIYLWANVEMRSKCNRGSTPA